MSDFDAFIDTLGSDPVHIRANSVSERFPCGQCAGTGVYQGPRVHQTKTECFACRGKGYFKTSPKFRADQRAKAAQKRDAAAEELSQRIKTFAETNPEMFKDLCAGRTEFTASLYASLMRWGTLTANQIAAWHRGWEKLQAMRAAKDAEANAKSGTVNLDRIREMFDAAVSSGYKKPVYRAEGLKISLASLTGRNAGCLYVVEIDDDAYQGKIDDVTFKAVREAKADTLARLQTIAADPGAAAVAYGRRTGTCSCCGRELTNHASIEAGIGPICAQKWGF